MCTRDGSAAARLVRAGPSKFRKYSALARGPFFTPVVDVARAYVAAAIPDPAASEAERWALSCLPGTTPRRLSALTMRITDILVINIAEPATAAKVDVIMIVERSALEAGFGSRAAARKRHPKLRFTDSDYHGAGADQMMIRGPGESMVRCLADERVAEAARQLATRMMRSGRAMHWRGHNPLLADDVLGRA